MKKEYTKEIHAARLIKMLEKRWPDGELGCPAAPRYNPKKSAVIMWKNIPCRICVIFLCFDLTDIPDWAKRCPCDHFKSCAEAAKRSWLKLEEEGYI